MTPTIDPTDPRYFLQTSDEPYDRHQYVLSYNGEKELLFDDYDHLRKHIGLKQFVISVGVPYKF